MYNGQEVNCLDIIDDDDYRLNEKNSSCSAKSQKRRRYISQAEYSFARIQNTSLEVNKIKNIFKKNNCKKENLKIFLRQDANEALIKQMNDSGALKNFQYIHFACHGILGVAIPWLKQPALVLSQHRDQKEDGFLKLSDIFNLRLNARLVILSACETALGKEYKGEGLVGLTRGFMFAGSPRIISSLWSVADKETAAFMTALYSAMIEAGHEPITALLETKIKLKQKKQHPFYWAPFIQIGS